jgi:uncharacterized Zn-binding protein involved in type VI secretion
MRLSEARLMRTLFLLPISTVMLSVAICVTGASAQQKRDDPASWAPGVFTQGSDDVSVGGQGAARSGDTTGAVVQGSSNVFINGKPAVTLGDRTGCGGVTVGGSSNVFINGKPVARAGDMTTGCEGK